MAIRIPQGQRQTRPSSQGLGYLQPAVADLSGLTETGTRFALGVAARIQERDDKTARFSALQDFAGFETKVDEMLLEQKKASAPNDLNFRERVSQTYDNYENDFISRLPPEFQPEFSARAAQVRQKVESDTRVFHYEQQGVYFKTGVDATAEKAKLGLKANPSKADLFAWKSRMDEVIDSADVSELQKMEWRKTTYQDLENVVYRDEYKKLKASVQGRAAEAQEFFMGMGLSKYGSAALVGRLIQESQLDPTAVAEGDAGPGLDSAGIGQWNKERLAGLKAFASKWGYDWQNTKVQLRYLWNELLTTEKGSLMALQRARNEDEAATAAIGFFRPRGWSKDNPTAGHGYGNGLENAKAVLGLGDFAVGDSIDDDLAFINMPYEDRLSARGDVDLELTAEQKAAKQAATERNDAMINAVMVGLHDGTMGQQQIDELRESGVATKYEDINKLQSILDKRIEKYKDLRAVTDLLSRDDGWLDPNSESHKKGVNEYIGEEGLERLRKRDPAYAQSLVPFVARAGMVPTTVAGQLTGMTRAQDPKAQLFALDLLAQMQDQAPEAYKQGFTDEVEQAVNVFQHNKGLGLDMTSMLNSLRGGATQEERQTRDALQDDARKLLTDSGRKGFVDIDDKLKSMFNDYWWQEEHMPMLPSAMVGLKQEFQTLFVDQYPKYGNVEDTIEKGVKPLLRKNWGVSEIGGLLSVMKYVPEDVYPKLNGSHAWMETEIRSFFRGADTTGIVEHPTFDPSMRPRWPTEKPGEFKTIRSGTFEFEGRTVVLPTVNPATGQDMTAEQVRAEYLRTGQHLGIFDTLEHAEAYSKALSKTQGVGVLQDHEPFQMLADEQTQQDIQDRRFNPSAPAPSYLIVKRDAYGTPHPLPGRVRLSVSPEQARNEEGATRLAQDTIAYENWLKRVYIPAAQHNRLTGIPIPAAIEAENQVRQEHLKTMTALQNPVATAEDIALPRVPYATDTATIGNIGETVENIWASLMRPSRKQLNEAAARARRTGSR